jgi:hypothetical protein
MAYRRFQTQTEASAAATIANPATVLPLIRPTVARLANVADEDRGNSATTGSVRARPATPAISLADWDAYFDERAGVREFEGGLPRYEAERLATDDTVGALGPRPSNWGR